jgi:hypothetical protein
MYTLYTDIKMGVSPIMGELWDTTWDLNSKTKFEIQPMPSTTTSIWG